MKSFTEEFCRISPLSEEAAAILDSLVTEVTLPRKTVLVRPGQQAPHLWYLRKGLLRVFSEDRGKETTWSFREEGQFYGDPGAVLSGGSADRGAELLERSVLEYIDTSQYARWRQFNHELERAWGRLLGFALLESQRSLEGIHALTAQQRYEGLRRSYPTLLNRVPLKYIASYLGVTTVSLSRIRAASKQAPDLL